MKCLRLKMLANGEWRLTAPLRIADSDILRFIQDHHAQLKELAAQQKPLSAERIPESFHTRAHLITIKKGFQFRCQIRNGHCQLTIPQNQDIDNLESRQFLLKSLQVVWKIEAQNHIPRRVQTLAESTKLIYNSVTIRPNRSRWGSCGPKGDLNFSLFLMLLDDSLIDYVIWHELAHLREKNHGASFWQHLESLHPGSRGLDSKLSKLALGQIHFIKVNEIWQCTALENQARKLL